MNEPKLPVPEPLRGSEIGSFAYKTVAVRMPDIARRVLQENQFPQEIVDRMEALINELPEGKIRLLEDEPAPDLADWQSYLSPCVGQSWLEIPWFFAENYFYRRILEAGHYFRPGPTNGHDPFAHQKRTGLESSEKEIEALCERQEALRKAKDHKDALQILLTQSLWGNQVDLSIWPVGKEAPSHADENQARAHLLVDHAAAGAACLARHIPFSRVDILLDNAGFELVGDLCLADYLLQIHSAAHVRLHVKAQPTFVSDAMVKDIRLTITHLATSRHPAVHGLALRLAEALSHNRIQLAPNTFWTSPLPLWKMPDALRHELGEAGLVISKGDANYRRSLGDCHWAFETPIKDILSYLPTRWLLLRTLKSEIVAGLKDGQAEETGRGDPDWLTDGKWGVIQFI